MDYENLDRLVDLFDVKSYLVDEGIRLSEEGDNTSPGWINIKCPFCSDHANHLGINLDSMKFSCWLCREKGTIVKLVKAISRCSFPVVKSILKDHQLRRSAKGKARERKTLQGESAKMPVGMENIVPGSEPSPVVELLRRRRFPISYASRFRCGWTPGYAEFPMRMIVPYILDGKIMSWIGVDTTGKSEKYRFCVREKSIIVPTDMLYGLDYLPDDNKPVVLVEGIFDKWRVGDYALALSTKDWNTEQTAMLRARIHPLRPVVIWLDNDATRDATNLEVELSKSGRTVYVVDYDEQDPKDPDLFDSDAIGQFLSTLLPVIA